MSHQRRGLGQTGEELAVQALIDAGLSIIERNWRCASGELDIVATENAVDYTLGGQVAPWLVFVEVRTRRGFRHGTALESVDQRKQNKLKEVAHHYVQEHEWNGAWRIDVVGVQMDGSGRLLSIDHVRHAVQG